MPTRLITPSQLSLFSISPVNGAWWEELQQCIPLDLTEVVRADQAVDASGMGRDAAGGQHTPHHPFHPFGVVLDLGAVLAEDPPGDVFRGCRAASSEQLHQHQRLVDVQHAHPPVDVLRKVFIRTGSCGLHQ